MSKADEADAAKMAAVEDALDVLYAELDVARHALDHDLTRSLLVQIKALEAIVVLALRERADIERRETSGVLVGTGPELLARLRALLTEDEPCDDIEITYGRCPVCDNARIVLTGAKHPAGSGLVAEHNKLDGGDFPLWPKLPLKCLGSLLPPKE